MGACKHVKNPQSNYTPAPWKIDEFIGQGSSRSLEIIRDVQGESVSHIAIINEDFIDPDMAMANAYLMTSSPLLLEALKKSRDSLLAMKEMLNSQGMAYGLGLTFKMIDEAINLAEGKSK
jgi:hypothetical protein